MTAIRAGAILGVLLALPAGLGFGSDDGTRAIPATPAPRQLTFPVGGGLSVSAPSDPQQRLRRLGAAPPADPSNPPPTRECPDPPCFDPSAGRTPAAYFAWLGNDLNRFWRTRVVAIPFQWPGGRQLLVLRGKPRRSRCAPTPVTTLDGPFYCSDDRPRTVFVPVEWMREFILRKRTWAGWRTKDFAFAYVVAHEWGHHLQDAVGILRNTRLRPIQLELQADCLAGVWAHSVWARNLLEPGDIQEAIALARLAGDRPGTPRNDPGAHGSPSQRATWFRRGYNTGEAQSCIVPAG